MPSPLRPWPTGGRLELLVCLCADMGRPWCWAWNTHLVGSLGQGDQLVLEVWDGPASPWGPAPLASTLLVQGKGTLADLGSQHGPPALALRPHQQCSKMGQDWSSTKTDEVSLRLFRQSPSGVSPANRLPCWRCQHGRVWHMICEPTLIYLFMNKFTKTQRSLLVFVTHKALC